MNTLTPKQQKVRKVLCEQLYDFNVIHGRFIVGTTVHQCSLEIPILEKEIRISNDVQVITVIDEKGRYANPLHEYTSKQLVDSRPIEFITCPEYIRWISKPQGIVQYIEQNYDSLPNYILYADAFDTLLIKDLENPKEMLDYYQCKILFNHEGNFSHTGAHPPEDMPAYFSPVSDDCIPKYMKLSEERFGPHPHPAHAALNAGVFIGEKDYVLNLMKEVISLMQDDYHMGFPHGCQDDQILLRYLHVKYYDDIGIDIFHRYFFWCPPTLGNLIQDDTNCFSLGFDRKRIPHFENYRITNRRRKILKYIENNYEKLPQEFIDYLESNV
jgi:hypothetical protein